MTITIKYNDGHTSDHEILEAVEAVLKSDKKIFVFEGGSGAGKTWAVIIIQILLALSKENQRFVWMRERLTWFKKTTLKEFKKCMVKLELWDEKNHNKSEFEYILNNNEIYYTGLDEKSKFLSTDWDYGWINEAIDDRITYEDFFQIVMRTKEKLFIDYNPSKIKSWIYDKVIPRDDCMFIHSTIFDNPYCPESRKTELLNTTDPILRLIYLEGKRAQARGLIFPDVALVPEYPTEPKREIIGMDFGFTNAPTAIVRMCFNQGQLWIDEIAYEYGLGTIEGSRRGRSIETILNENKINRHEEIIADSNETGAIRALQSKGWNVKPANKYSGSVKDGIDAIKRYQVNITEMSMNIIDEQRQYKWQVINGITVNKPYKDWDHAWDAIRYGVMYRESHKLFPGGGGVSLINLADRKN